MPVVPCPTCRNSVDLPADGGTYACPHCRRPIAAPVAPPPPQHDDEPDEAPVDFGRGSRSVRVRRDRTDNPVGDFLSFRAMVTPVIIAVLFWIGATFSFAIGILGVVTGVNMKGRESEEFRLYVIAAGALYAIVGPILVRVTCELLIVIFKIHDELKESNDRARLRER